MGKVNQIIAVKYQHIVSMSSKNASNIMIDMFHWWNFSQRARSNEGRTHESRSWHFLTQNGFRPLIHRSSV